MTLSPRELASKGPMALKDPSSVDYAWQLTDKIRRLYETKELTIQQWEQVLEDAERYRIYERVPEDRPYGNLNALLEAEIGHTDEDVRRQLLTHQEAGRMGGRGNKAGSDTTSFGRDAEYLTARIARDRPDILEDMQAGKYKSVRAAALEAGIVRPRFTVPADDVRAIARALVRHLTVDQIEELTSILTGNE
jgi:hypothetical protein